MVAGVLALLILGLAGQQALAFRERRRQREAEAKTIEKFDRRVTVLMTGLSESFQALSADPEQFRTGQLPAPDFKSKAEVWATSFRKVLADLSASTAPPGLREAKSLYEQAMVMYLDSIRSFQMAAEASDPAVRDQLIGQGRNLTTRGASSLSLGRRLIDREKLRLGLLKEDQAQFMDQPLPPPQENVPAPPQAPTSPPQTAPPRPTAPPPASPVPGDGSPTAYPGG